MRTCCEPRSRRLTQALGSQVQMREFAFHWSGFGPSVELYDVILHGAAPYENPPLLQADSLRVQVTITSFLHRSWYVDDIRIEHPIVRVFADNRGHTNIPAAKPKDPNQQNSTNIFDLGIRHLLLERGEAYYNDQKSNLNADLQDLNFQAGYELLRKQYSGRPSRIKTATSCWKTRTPSCITWMLVFRHRAGIKSPERGPEDQEFANIGSRKYDQLREAKSACNLRSRS